MGPESQGPPRALKTGSLATKWLAALRATTCSALHDFEVRAPHQGWKRRGKRGCVPRQVTPPSPEVAPGTFVPELPED